MLSSTSPRRKINLPQKNTKHTHTFCALYQKRGRGGCRTCGTMPHLIYTCHTFYTIYVEYFEAYATLSSAVWCCHRVKQQTKLKRATQSYIVKQRPSRKEKENTHVQNHGAHPPTIFFFFTWGGATAVSIRQARGYLWEFDVNRQPSTIPIISRCFSRGATMQRVLVEIGISAVFSPV